MWRSLRRAEHFSRGVLPNVIVKPRQWWGPDSLWAVAPWRRGVDYGLFGDAVNSPDYTQSNGEISSQMTNQTGRERSGLGLIGDNTLGFICSGWEKPPKTSRYSLRAKSWTRDLPMWNTSFTHWKATFGAGDLSGDSESKNTHVTSPATDWPSQEKGLN